MQEQVVSFNRHWKNSLKYNLILLPLSIVAVYCIWQISLAQHSTYRRTDTILYMLVSYFIWLSFRGWIDICRVSSKGIVWRNYEPLAWDAMEFIQVDEGIIAPNYLVIKGKQGSETRIPWPISRPDEFEKLCNQFAAPENPLNLFLGKCSVNDKKHGSFPRFYHP